MVRKFFQVISFFFPSPINVWLHRLWGAKIGRHVSIHPGVLILAKSLDIGDEARIKFGSMINVRNFNLGRKSSIGFFTLVKGESDLNIGDACIIGPRSMINCSREVRLDYYSGVGPGCYLYTHGSGMPVTEGYRTTFGPIHIRSKVWVSMRCVIGPNVTIEEGTNVMPGTVLVESVAPHRLVVGNPARLKNFPVLLIPRKPEYIEELALKILEGYCNWSNEFKETSWQIEDGILKLNNRKQPLSISVNGGGDITLFTRQGDISDGMYFNLADLSTDKKRHPEKIKLEAFMRLYYGLIFL